MRWIVEFLITLLIDLKSKTILNQSMQDSFFYLRKYAIKGERTDRA